MPEEELGPNLQHLHSIMGTKPQFQNRSLAMKRGDGEIQCYVEYWLKATPWFKDVVFYVRCLLASSEDVRSLCLNIFSFLANNFEFRVGVLRFSLENENGGLKGLFPEL